jgi:uncharacterized protein
MAEPLRIAVIGASGRIDRFIVREALSRGHEVTAVARDSARLGQPDGAAIVSADVLNADSIREAIAGQHAVVAAVKGRDASESETVPTAARVLLDVLPRAGVRRLLFVGGGGSLETAPGQRFLDRPDFPAQYRGEALAQAEALAILRASNGVVDWSYASPPPFHLFDGPRTGTYRVRAGDRPLDDGDGVSRISVADYAAAIVDVLEGGSFVCQRFATAY